MKFRKKALITLLTFAAMTATIIIGWRIIGRDICPELKNDPCIVSLAEYDRETYDLCLRLSHHPSFTKGKVHFWVTMMFSEPCCCAEHKCIFLTPEFLNNGHLEIAVAHELGHIENPMANEIECDKFAIRICGRNKYLKFAKHYENFLCLKRIIAALAD